MKEVKVSLPESDIQLLDQIAKEKNTSRAEIIRSNIANHGLSTDSLHRVAIAIRKRLHGVFTIQQAEQAAAIAIYTIANGSKKAA
jgi:metal-responsive CopG/Arc/MetJ family transcriptional regulator